MAEAFPEPSTGDTYLLNDPYHGGSHLPDLTIFVPVFAAASLRFWSVVRAHQSDIGGATHGGYNPGATEIWQEGLRIPPIRLGESGGLRDDLLRMLATNTRIPRDFRGDLMAMIGAARLGEQRLLPLLAKYGADGWTRRSQPSSTCRAPCPAHPRRPGRTASVKGEAFLDDDGFDRTDIAIRARVTKRGSEPDGGPVGERPADHRLRQFLLPQHAQRRRDGVCLPARPGRARRMTAPSAR